jgi:hypothetical protein
MRAESLEIMSKSGGLGLAALEGDPTLTGTRCDVEERVFTTGRPTHRAEAVEDTAVRCDNIAPTVSGPGAAGACACRQHLPAKRQHILVFAGNV